MCFDRHDDGPDLDDILVFVTTCKDCGWEDEESYEDQADCTIERCLECNSERLVDEETTQGVPYEYALEVRRRGN